ncbi:MAG: polysaccharide lyase 6 family protein [Phycisphaeraceae bacterium]
MPILLLNLAAFALAVTFTAPPVRAQTAVDDLQKRLDAATPGTVIDLPSGNLRLTQPLVMIRSGSAEQPITIRPKNKGGVTIEGKAGFLIKGAGHVVIEGLTFACDNTRPAIELIDCQNIRITRNRFRVINTPAPRQNWVHIYGGLSGSNRIDRNLFEGLSVPGAFIAIDGSEKEPYQISKGDLIEFNHFKDIAASEAGGARAIRLGWTGLGASVGQTVVENNLFDNCDGDTEIITVRSSGQTLRFNTFRNCSGYVTLRLGSGNTIEANFFQASPREEKVGAIRVHGSDAKVFNNYMEGMTQPAILLPNGVKTTSPGQVPRPAAKGAAIVFNTLVDCLSGSLDISNDSGGSWPEQPTNCIIANNVVIAYNANLIETHGRGQGVTWLGNIMYHAGDRAKVGLDLPVDQINITVPKLRNPGDFWRLGPSSPAIDSALGDFDYVINDIEGQARSKKKDAGSDESVTGATKNKPLADTDVGVDLP